jgi:hypothetical protein
LVLRKFLSNQLHRNIKLRSQILEVFNNLLVCDAFLNLGSPMNLTTI